MFARFLLSHYTALSQQHYRFESAVIVVSEWTRVNECVVCMVRVHALVRLGVCVRSGSMRLTLIRVLRVTLNEEISGGMHHISV